ncbi:restriction endonuclease subunit S [Nocardia sp. NPDC057227]|uniref:restriction endonuclease subunit S n=1 Tax=Nocardia sp. NPDC057227 TaxID=3346056 RepID=UPI00362C32DD
MTAPDDWAAYTLGELFDFSNGINADKSAYGRGVPFVNVMEVTRNEALTPSQIPGRITLPKAMLSRYEVKRGDVLFNRTSETLEEVGMTAVYDGDEPVVFGGFVFRGRPRTSHMSSRYAKYALRAAEVREQIIARGQGEIRSNVGQRDLKTVRLHLPDLTEQAAIVGTLDDATELITRLARLIEKERKLHKGLMQGLLTGATRLPGFSAPWRRTTLETLLAPRKERNADRSSFEVLSCTKHLGFVRSLDYFKNQVFSRDLSGYWIIRRGDIGYPANHVEEGSIGVQDLYDVGLVSPIYVVLRPLAGVNSFFLQRQLKLEKYRQEFAKVTNASVNRRGSLRWPQFSQIEVWVPSYDEQSAIAEVLRESEGQIRLLELRHRKAVDVKQGMMQELLTGRTRLPEVAAS